MNATCAKGANFKFRFQNNSLLKIVHFVKNRFFRFFRLLVDKLVKHWVGFKYVVFAWACIDFAKLEKT